MDLNDRALGRIVEAMRQPVRNYSDLVRHLGGENARGLTLFGAILSDSFDVQRHTVRSVLVLERVDLSLLRRLADQGVKLGKAHITAPLIMTPQYVKESLDTFPLEFLEIVQHHVTVFGEDVFADLSFSDADIRLQCERELKTILIGLRQGLLAAAGRDTFLSALQKDIGEALMRTLRGLLWLKGHKEPRPARDVLDQVETLTQSGLSGVRTALDPDAEHGWSQFETLYRDVEGLGEMVNGW